nr:MAG TPA: hypothetical protein [Caudoviricetes sp.]
MTPNSASTRIASNAAPTSSTRLMTALTWTPNSRNKTTNRSAKNAPVLS